MILTGFAIATIVMIPAIGQAQDDQPAPQVSAVEADDAAVVGNADGNPVGKLQARLDDELDDLHARGIYPDIGWITAGSGLSFGLGLRDAHLLDSPLAAEVEGMWSLRNYQRYGAAFGRTEHRRDAVELRPADANITSLFTEPDSRVRGTAVYLSAWYRRSPRVDFYGFGSDATGTRTDFAVSGTTLDGVVQWQRNETFGLSMRGGILDFTIGQGSNLEVPNLEERFNPDEAPGLLHQPRYVTAGLAAVADNRSNTDVPVSGGYLGVALWHFVPVGREAQGRVTRVALDWREYRSIVSDRHVAAVRLLAAADHNSGQSQTPFYLQYSLGGTRSLRGFSSYRFRGTALTHLSAEYRWRAAQFVEIAGFVDAGAVATGFSRLSESPLHVTPGIGVRFRTDEQILLRIDWAHGSEGHKFQLFVGPAF